MHQISQEIQNIGTSTQEYSSLNIGTTPTSTIKKNLANKKSYSFAQKKVDHAQLLLDLDRSVGGKYAAIIQHEKDFMKMKRKNLNRRCPNRYRANR